MRLLAMGKSDITRNSWAAFDMERPTLTSFLWKTHKHTHMHTRTHTHKRAHSQAQNQSGSDGRFAPQAARLSDGGLKVALRMALDCARLRASRELDGGESLMVQTMAPESSCCSSCCDSCRLKAMASAANWVRSLVLLFLEGQQENHCHPCTCCCLFWAVNNQLFSYFIICTRITSCVSYLCRTRGVGRPLSGAFCQ